MSSEDDPAEPLACPSCTRRYPLSERFCVDCQMPLVHAGRGEEEPVTDSHERARKVDPRYATGAPVKVGFASNLAEAQLIQGILLEQGIPSVERRSRGFDVPDFLAAGPRDVLVPESAAELARELLSEVGATAEHPLEQGATAENPMRLALWLGVALVAALVIVALLYLAAR